MSAVGPIYAVYPWSAVVGQDALKQALLLCAIDPSIGGVLVRGPRGVAKTTLARALGELVPGRFVELPLGASEERVSGTLDLDRALRAGEVAFSPGLLARAHEGVLYVDEVNLLPDSLVDLLLDAAASGRNIVERDGVSHVHDARFVLVGTMNPEEGELRPQLVDRFGLSVTAAEQIPPAQRAEIVRRRLAFDADAAGFLARFAERQARLVERCRAARARAVAIPLEGPGLEHVSERCYRAQVEGVRADLAMLRAARAHAAWHERDEIGEEDVAAVAELALAHRRRGQPPAPGSRGGEPGPDTPPPRAQDPSPTAPRSRASARERAAPRSQTGEPVRELGPRAPDGSGRAASGQPGAQRPPDAGELGAADERGRLAAIPVRAAPPPELPSWLLPARGRRADSRRRRRGVLPSQRGAPGPRSIPSGSIDWFATLARRPRPRREDLCYRARRAPPSQLWILAVDCSTSMLRSGALALAKGVTHALERLAVAAGAHVALISFRGAEARVEISSRAGRAVVERAIDALGGGGGTPLREALRAALALCARRAWRSPEIAKRLVLLTDARTREHVDDLGPFPTELERVVVDCERANVRLRRAPLLARALAGRYLHVDALRGRALCGAAPHLLDPHDRDQRSA